MPELLRRPGLRVNVLLALRDDALAELDDFAGRIPELFSNLLRLDLLDREAGRAAILGPLARYSELAGETFTAEDALVEAVLDEASSDAGVEAPYLQLVLERLWERERESGSRELRLETLRAIGGARAVVREHVQGALDRLPLAEQEAAARVVRQLVTPSGRKVSHEPSDLAEYAQVEDAQLRQLLDTLGRERIVRGVNGMQGAPTRYEIFHDVLGPPILAWQAGQQLRRERIRAHRQRRRLLVIIGASLVALAVVAAIAAYALVQRSDARTQARHARGGALAGRASADIATNPQVSVHLALRAAALAPGRDTADVLRSSLGAMRETRILRLGGNIVFAAFAPRGERLLVASDNGRLGLYSRSGRLLAKLPRQEPADRGRVEPGRPDVRYGLVRRHRRALAGREHRRPYARSRRPRRSLRFRSTAATLLIGSGTHVRLVDLATGRIKTVAFPAAVVTAALDPTGHVFAVATRFGKSTNASIVNAHTGRVVRRLPDPSIRSFAFSPDGQLLASGSYDRTARIWNAATGKQLQVLPHSGYVLAERFSADGRSLVTSSQDGAAYVWDVANGQRDLLLVGATGALNESAFSPDGSEIATASDDRLGRLYYSQDGRLLAPLAGSATAVTSIGFDPSGRTVVTGSSGGTARLWDALPQGTLRPVDRRATPVQTFWAGRDLVTVAGRRARILRPTGRLVQQLTMSTPIVAAAARDRTVALADRSGDLLLDRGGVMRLTHGVDATALAVERGGRVLVGRHNTVTSSRGRVLDVVGGRVLGLSTGGGRFLVRLADSVRVYSRGGDPVSTIDVATPHAVLSPGGLGVGTTKGTLAQLWDASTGKLLHTLKGHRLTRQRRGVLAERPRARDGQLRPHWTHLERPHRSPTPRPRRSLLRRQHRQLQPRRPLDRHLEPVHRRPLERGYRPAPLLPRPRHSAADQRELQPGRQLDPHRQRGRHRPRVPLRDLRAVAGPGGDRPGADPRASLGVDRRRSAARLVQLCELQEKRVELRPLLRVERCEELVLQPPGQRAQLAEHLLAVGCEADEVATPVVGAALALDEPLLLELVEQSDERSAVVAERVRDRRLRLGCTDVQQGEDRVVVRVEPDPLVFVDRPLLGSEAEALEQEEVRFDELCR